MSSEGSEVSRLLLKLGKIIEKDEAIKSYCQEQFGKNHTVYIGINNEQAPPEDAYPLVVLFYAERFRGDGANRIRYAVEIGVGVFNDHLNAELPDNPNLYVYIGLRQAEDLRELVENAVFKSRFGKTDIEGDTRSEVYFPLFRSNTLITIELVASSRTPMER